jgi:hypothetical protein
MKKVTATITIILLFLTNISAQFRPLSYVMDMVHNNPGDTPYESKFNDPKVLKKMGFNSKSYFLFESPMLAINWDALDPDILPVGSPDRTWVDNKAAILKVKYDACVKNKIDVYAMSDLVLFPKRLIKKYGIEKTFGNPNDTQTEQLLRFQLQQMFKQFPQMAGIVVRIGETYLEDAPFHKGNIQKKDNADSTIIPLINILREEICVKLNKKLIFRTWWAFDTDAKKYEYISEKIEPHKNLIISIKHCEGDFHRGNPFSKVLGLGRHPQLVEVQCAREYEGKGAFPNYVAKGVIDGFEEHDYRRKKGEISNLKELYATGKLQGMWTWSRGGGWEGPYPKSELWCELNAWVMAQWANNPTESEESIFNRYTRNVLKLNKKDAAKFRRIALLSDSATLRGMRSVAYPNDVFSMWVRDEYITFPALPKDAQKAAVIVSDKAEAEQMWNEIVELSKQIRFKDKETGRVVLVTCEYGRQMYRIFNALFQLSSIEAGYSSAENTKKYIAQYDNAWEILQTLPKKYPAECPTLFSKTVIRRTWPTAADVKVNEMRKK